MKACATCHTFQPRSNYYSHYTNKDGLGSSCKACVSAREKIRSKTRDNNTPARVSSKMKQKYGITLEEYEKKLAMQSGVCMICGNEETNGKRLAIDHNHTTKAVRGLLCNHCNLGLGKFFENPNLLTAAINYLKEYE